MFKKENGITLVALVITIVVLLILSGVAISSLTGKENIMNRANQAKTKAAEDQAKTDVMLQEAENFINNAVGPLE